MISHEDVIDLIDYNPLTGVLASKVRRGKLTPGTVLGSTGPNGYMRLCVRRKVYLAHRLAWFIHYGQWPSGEIDHINNNPSDNRICNLRDVSHRVNNQNKSSHSGYGIGVKKSGRRYESRILVGQDRVHLGCYATPEMASKAYNIAVSLLDQCIFPSIDTVRSLMPAGWDDLADTPRSVFCRSNRSPHGIGVRRNGQMYESRISINGNRVHLGSYPEPQQASRAYETACQLIKLGIEPDRDRVKRYMKEIK